MNEENEVVVETENPQEMETPQTPPEKDYKQMFEDQRRRAEKAEQEAKELQSRLSSNNVLLEEGTDDKESSRIKNELAEIKAKLAKTEVQEAYPILKDSWKDFEEFRELEENKGMNLRTAAKAFLVEKGMLEPTRKGLEKPTGGQKTPTSSGMSTDEIKHLRETNYRKYTDMLMKGQIKM